MSELVQIATTTSSEQDARRIAAALVERRLAACVQVAGPITSTYRWEGKVEESQEWRCTMKTTEALYADVEAAIRELHTYDVPEILATPIVAGDASYVDWVRNEVRRP